jgi:hypothetical protein
MDHTEAHDVEAAFQELGRPITRADLAETDGLFRHLQASQVALRSLRESVGDGAAYRQQADRMEAVAAEKLRAVQASASHEWQPEGTVADLDARYVHDGRLQLGSWEHQIRMPGGERGTIRIPGLLTDRAVHPAQQRVQDVYRGWHMVRRSIRAQQKTERLHLLEKRAYQALYMALRALPGKSGDLMRSALQAWVDAPEGAAYAERVMSETVGGAGLIDEPRLDPRIIRETDVAMTAAGRVPVVTVDRRTFQRPLQSGRGMWQVRGELTGDPSTFPVQSFTLTKDSLTIVDWFINLLVDPRWQELMTNVQDPTELIRAWIDRAKAYSWAWSFFHGDGDTPHQDDPLDTTFGGFFDVALIQALDSPLHAWDGWRKHALSRSTPALYGAGASFDIQDHFRMMDLFGVHAGDGSIVAYTGLKNLFRNLMGADDLVFRSTVGEGLATAISGVLATLAGTPLAVDMALYEGVYDKVTGLITASDPGHTMVYVAHDWWVNYEKPSSQDAWEENVKRKGATWIGEAGGNLLATTAPSADTVAAVMVDLPL